MTNVVLTTKTKQELKQLYYLLSSDWLSVDLLKLDSVSPYGTMRWKPVFCKRISDD